MTTYYITRHAGTMEWLRAQGDVPKADVETDHLEPGDIKKICANDRIYGILPIPLVMQITGRGAYYFHVDVKLNQGERAGELSKADLEARGAKLVDVIVMERQAK